MFLKCSSRSVAAVVGGVLVAVSACSKKDAGTSDTGMGSTGDSSAMAVNADTGMGANATPTAGLSDANIFYLLDRANMGDSAGGSLASSKGTNADVRAFGKAMMTDHHKLRADGAALATKLGISPAAPSNDTTQAHMDKMSSLLNGAAKGRDFDKAYIDSEVEAHKAVLEFLTMAGNTAQSSDLKNAIQKAAPVVQGHLDLAQSIQQKLK